MQHQLADVYLHVDVGQGDHDTAESVEDGCPNHRRHVPIPLLRDLGVDLFAVGMPRTNRTESTLTTETRKTRRDMVSDFRHKTEK